MFLFCYGVLRPGGVCWSPGAVRLGGGELVGRWVFWAVILLVHENRGTQCWIGVNDQSFSIWLAVPLYLWMKSETVLASFFLLFID